MPILTMCLGGFFIAFVTIQFIGRPPAALTEEELANYEFDKEADIDSNERSVSAEPVARATPAKVTKQPEQNRSSDQAAPTPQPQKRVLARERGTTKKKQPSALRSKSTTKSGKYHCHNIWAASVKEGSFEIKSSMPTLPVITCDYRIPLGQDGKIMPTAHDLVLLFPFPTEKQAIKGIAKDLTAKWGFSTLSLRFPGFGRDSAILGGDRERFYYYPESGAGQAWIDAIARVREIGGLEERPVFVTGRSGGGSAASLFADAYPELVAAVANEAGRVFADEAAFKGPTLMMYGAHDYVVPPVEAWLSKAQDEAVDVVSYTFPPGWRSRGRSRIWQHSIHGPARKAFLRWIIDIADMRIQHGGIPSSSAWPVQQDGIAYSSEAFKAFMDKVIKRSVVTETADAWVVTSLPAPAGNPPRGTVVLVGDSFSSSLEELQLDAEQMADNDWRCIAILPHSDLDLESCIRSQLSFDGAYADLPAILMMDNASHISKIVAADVYQWLGIIVSRPRSSLVKNIFSACAGNGMNVQVIATKEHITQMKAAVDTDFKAQWSAIKKVENRGQWHQARNHAAISMIKRWAKRKAR